MEITAPVLFDTASRLHSYLVKNHWNGQALEGPDSGIRFNARFGRFAKSYLSFLPWSDNYRYMQAQGYWILDNWLLSDLTEKPQFRDLALACSEYVRSAQRSQGFWEYPNPEWRGRIATVEGDFATLGLLESYRRTGEGRFILGAKKWCEYLVDGVGFQGNGGPLAVNYFANVPGGMVPNNSTLTLLTLAELARATGDDKYLSRCEGMVTWLKRVQLRTGELPYAMPGSAGRDRPHFLCYQYNAFEFLDLARYHLCTGDRVVLDILGTLAAYLATGITRSGSARYDCHHEGPEVPYYTAALAAALSQASLLGLGDFRPSVDRAFGRVLSQVRADGGLQFFSRGNYGVLADRRSYPRNLAMILHHLLLEARNRAPVQAAVAGQ